MRNLLLRQLDEPAQAALLPYLEPVNLRAKQVLYTQDEQITHVYFVESGFVSFVAVGAHERIEVGIVGCEGAVGTPVVITDEAPHAEAIVWYDGEALRIPVDDLRSVLKRFPDAERLLVRYGQWLFMQVVHTSLANGRGTVQRRLARWFLMAHDRIQGDEIPFTHETLAQTLSVQRPMVTVALHVLEGVKALRSRRNAITILNRSKLKKLAGESYGQPEDLYGKMFRLAFAK